MGNRFILVPEEEGKPYGVVKPVEVRNGKIYYGLSIGSWTLSDTDNRIHLTLNEDIDTIIHEVATSKAARAELRAADKDNRGVEIKPIITLDIKTKRFKEVYPIKEG